MQIKTIERRTKELRIYDNVESVKLYLQESIFIGGKAWAAIEMRSKKGEKITTIAIDDYEIEIKNRGAKWPSE